MNRTTRLLGMIGLAALASTGCGVYEPNGPSAAPQAANAGPIDPLAAQLERKQLVVATEEAAKELRRQLDVMGYEMIWIDVSDRKFDLRYVPKFDTAGFNVGESQGLTFMMDAMSAARLPHGIGIHVTRAKGKPSLGFFSRLTEVDPPDPSVSLAEARKGFETKLVRQKTDGNPPAEPPSDAVRLVHYKSSAAELAAYVTRAPDDGKRHPALIWLGGGGCNTIGPFWSDSGEVEHPELVTMIPSLRGGNDNPGFEEDYFGEVDDVLAAAEFLRQQTYVDPDRIYLGGHSTGGTLALLTAECSTAFRATFSFGPVNDVIAYGPQALHFDPTDPKEYQLRAPGRWLHSARNPVFVLEGRESKGFAASTAMSKDNTNPKVRFFDVPGADHFTVIALKSVVVAKILQDVEPTGAIEFTAEELAKPFNEQ